ncbi:MAG: hypothetical protein HDQ96_08935 [Lachnospiraceae bacterium]|nr:hypothetical protein [Lachnospiraceae bacterium]
MDWKTQLAEIEDEYLIGLTNKGIVKRSYKDKETAAIKILKLEDEAALQVDGETVILSIPLGESKCSCPSRSICKHIIIGMLALKESVNSNDSASSNKGKTEMSDDVSSDENDTTTSEKSDDSSLQKKLWDEILSYPEKDLYKIMGNRRLTSFLNKANGKIQPEIEESYIFTVKLPGENTTVKLLSPLNYSSCTCHKKELCIHKAEAILWCKLKADALSLENLEQLNQKDLSINPEQIKDASFQMKNYLEELMSTGLSRVSPDVVNSLDRFAVISHNTGLADFERAFRTLSTLYQSYLNREASFLTADLMKKLTELYSKVNILSETENITHIAKETGEFRAEYLPVGDLSLVGITMEHFEDAAGYEGETVYFLETDTHKWYTYTVARPVFYENKRKWGKPQKAEAPWGLNCNLENLVELHIHLKDARCDGRRRLSSSMETRGDILGKEQPDQEMLSDWYYEDFGKLFADQIKPPQKTGQKDSKPDIWGRDLVFIQPSFCERAVFSKTEQTLSMTLYDTQKREVILELAYSKEDAASIRYLEKIKENEPPCFIGKVYLRDGRIRLIPVDTWKYTI